MYILLVIFDHKQQYDFYNILSAIKEKKGSHIRAASTR